MLGTLINCSSILIGGIIGIFLKSRLSEKLQQTVMQAIGLAVLAIGISGLAEIESMIVIVLAMVIGACIGFFLDLDGKLNRFSMRLENRFSKKENHNFSMGIVSASLLFCVGSMAILGAFESGLSNNHTILLTKSILDFTSAMILASTFGWSVLLAAGVVLVYQGGLTLLSSFAAPWMSTAMIANMSGVGSLLIIALSLQILHIIEIRLPDFLPAILVALALTAVLQMI